MASARTRMSQVEEFDGDDSVLTMQAKTTRRCTQGQEVRSSGFRDQHSPEKRFQWLQEMGRQCPRYRKHIRYTGPPGCDRSRSQLNRPDRSESCMS